MKTTKLILIAAALAALSGCTTTHFKNANLELSRTAILTKNTISELTVNPTTGEISLKGYSNEQTETAVAVANAVARALTPAASVQK